MRQIQSKENHQTFTYQTRLVIDESTAKILDGCAKTFSHIERKLFADISAGKIAVDLKSEYLKEYQITARHFNAIRVQIEGKISSLKERQPQLIVEIGSKIQGVIKTIKKLEKNPASNKLHEKKRLLFNLQQKEKKLKLDQEAGKVRLCFGSKNLFRAQFNLEANGYASQEKWLADWQKTRSNSIFLLGSKDESGGNQSCTATLCDNDSLSLRLRLPDCLANEEGKYLIIPGIHFAYGHQKVVDCIKSCETRKQCQKFGDPNYKQYGLPISYRYKRDEKGWRLFVSVPVEHSKAVTSTKEGVIGIDINVNHLALTENDRFGNPLIRKSISLNTYGKSQNQTKALIGGVCANIVDYAKEKGKSLVVEDLDFQKKKTQLKEQSFSTLSRMLSSFAYKSIKNTLKARAWKNGVQIAEVNPAFTSLIGRVKFSKRYGLSIHHAAALTIGRRYLKFSERVPRHLDRIPDGKGGHVALSLPARNEKNTCGPSWKSIDRNLKTVLAAHFRAKKIRSSSCKPVPET